MKNRKYNKLHEAICRINGVDIDNDGVGRYNATSMTMHKESDRRRKDFERATRFELRDDFDKDLIKDRRNDTKIPHSDHAKRMYLESRRARRLREEKSRNNRRTVSNTRRLRESRADEVLFDNLFDEIYCRLTKYSTEKQFTNRTGFKKGIYDDAEEVGVDFDRRGNALLKITVNKGEKSLDFARELANEYRKYGVSVESENNVKYGTETLTIKIPEAESPFETKKVSDREKKIEDEKRARFLAKMNK